MESRKTSFEEHLNIASSGQDKTASAKKVEGGLLDQLAAELTGQEKVANAPVAEGEVSPAASSVAGAAEPVVAASAAVEVPQVAIAGGNEEEAQAGEVPAAVKPNEGVAISAGDGKVTDANNMHRTPESVAAAADTPISDVGGDVVNAATVAPEKAGQTPDGEEKVGQLIAQSFMAEIQKKAEDEEYTQALGILKEAGLLEGYDIEDAGMSKEASFVTGGLEKLANKLPLSRKEIVGAAHEVIEFNKEAADVEEQARLDAHEKVAELVEEEKVASETPEASTVNENTKLAELMKDPDVVSAVKLLQSKKLM